MRLATFLPPGATEPTAGEVRGREVIGFAAATVLERLSGGDRAPAEGTAWALDSVRLLAPIPRPPNVFCVGRNYSAHAAETGRELPERPLIFMKPSGAVTGPDGPVPRPAMVRELDYEAELCAVIGGAGEVAGYMIANDVTARDLQAVEAHWTRAKGADGFCPCGPWITTADEVEDPEDLSVRAWVNGELRQEGSTAELIFGITELVDFISETCTLAGGDLLLTGTPAGVGHALDPPRYLEHGDTVRIEIEALGSIEHRVVAA